MRPLFLSLALALAYTIAPPSPTDDAPPRRVLCKARFVDGDRVVDRLTRAARALVVDEKTVPMRTLREQLSRTKCSLPLAAPATDPLDAVTLYARHRRSVLLVAPMARMRGEWQLSPATGFVVAPGVAATNYHVLDARDHTLVVASADGKVYPVVEVLAASKADDVALIRFAGGKDLPPLPLGPTAPVGEPARVISHPNGRLYMLTRGIVCG